jgi:Mrp family chromosome partitioning ATPase/capsular polysaccharide biosynthesis protein
VATLAHAQLGNGDSVASLLDHVQAVPVAGSTVVAITADSTRPARAQMIANAFAAATIQQSTTQLQASLTAEAQHLQAQIAALPPSEPAAVVSGLAAQLTSVESLQGGQDPTLRVAAGAALPTSAASPHRLRTVAVALLAGLILGVGAALAAGWLDPVLRREDQLEARYALPVLAQIPAAFTGGRRHRLAGRLRHRPAARGPLVPGRAPLPVLDAYRALVPALTTAARGSSTEGSKPRSILVTSPSALEGKTTTAISLAWSLAAGGHRVILIEADFRRPAIGQALGISSEVGMGTLFDSAVADPVRRPRTPLNLDEALVSTRFHGAEFEVLLAGDGSTRGPTTLDRLASGGARELISLARRRADFVVIDSPALGEAMETLSLAQDADELVLVVALGETRMARLEHLGGLLQRYDVQPAGFVVVGVNRGVSGPAYGAG